MAKNIAIISTFWHQKDLDIMVKAARHAAMREGLNVVEQIVVPGAYEIPLALKRALALKKIDGAVVLGIIERGETRHGMVMGMVVHDAILRIELETGKAVGLAILGPEILPAQIPQRTELYARQAIEALKGMLL